MPQDRISAPRGPGLCRRTAGNGFALPQHPYSLFTGDIGAALYAQSCLHDDYRFPIVGVL